MDIKIRRKGKGNARFFNAYILFKILDQLLSVNIKDIDRFPQAAFFQDFFPRDIGGPYDADFPNMKTRTMDQEPKESKGNQEGKERAHHTGGKTGEHEGRPEMPVFLSFFTGPSFPSLLSFPLFMRGRRHGRAKRLPIPLWRFHSN